MTAGLFIMRCILRSYSAVAITALVLIPLLVNAQDSASKKAANVKQAPASAPSKKAVERQASANDVHATKAAFDAKFTEYKNAIREIEQTSTDFQTADAASREKLNGKWTSQIARAKTLVDGMVEAAMAAYAAAPNTDTQITKLLSAVARHYAIGRQIGPGQPSRSNPEDIYYPIDGGDQYERALPIVKLLIEKHADDKQLYVWGFLCAYMTNDYELARNYLTKMKETNAMQEIADIAQKGDKAEKEAGLMKMVMETISKCLSNLDQYSELWKKESQIRAAEAKANDLPRVKLTTTKGEVTVELFENEAPQTVANFLTLVKDGFYNGSPFHRVLPEFMAQGGAKTDEGQGGPGYTIKCECYRPDYRRHFRGTLSMAHAGRDTGNSQFFLTFVPTPHLNGLHTAFGRVIEGIEVLGDLQHRSPDQQREPPKADRIIKAEVLRDRGHEYKFDKQSE